MSLFLNGMQVMLFAIDLFMLCDVSPNQKSNGDPAACTCTSTCTYRRPCPVGMEWLVPTIVLFFLVLELVVAWIAETTRNVRYRILDCILLVCIANQLYLIGSWNRPSEFSWTMREILYLNCIGRVFVSVAGTVFNEILE